MNHTPGPLWKVPVRERCQRVARRVNRGIYSRQVGDYANSGAILFDEPRMAGDLGLSIEQLRGVLGTAPRKTVSGWTLPRCPTAAEILAAASAIAELVVVPAANSCVHCTFEPTCGYSPLAMSGERTNYSQTPCCLGKMSSNVDGSPGKPFFQQRETTHHAIA